MSANSFAALLRNRASAFLALAPYALSCIALLLTTVGFLIWSLPDIVRRIVACAAPAYYLLLQDWRAAFAVTALGVYVGARRWAKGVELAWWAVASACLSCLLAGKGVLPVLRAVLAPGLIFLGINAVRRWLLLPVTVRQAIRVASLASSVTLVLFALHFTKSWDIHFSDFEMLNAGAIGGAALFSLHRKPAGHFVWPARQGLDHAETIWAAQSRSGAGLCLAGDKSLLFSDSGHSFLSFAKCGRVWVAFSDPVGLPAESAELISKLTHLAHAHGGAVAFHQTHVEHLPHYLNAGLTLMKIGEEAYIELGAFDLCSPGCSHLRYALRRGQRDGLTFSVVPKEDVAPILPALRRVSTDWLTHRNGKEMGFSIAAFDETFPATQSIALVRRHGEPIAFACLMTTSAGAEAAIGAMRRVTHAPSLTMEYLFTHLALELRRRGLDRLSLGVAPFSEMEHGLTPSLWHRLGRVIGRMGAKYYNVRGLRAFKEKFSPTWEPRYLAASGSIGIFRALATLPLLISGSRS